jgi:hypothetical protein
MFGKNGIRDFKIPEHITVTSDHYICVGILQLDTEIRRDAMHVKSDVTGQVRGGLRAIFQQIGYSELCCGVQSLMDDENRSSCPRVATVLRSTRFAAA